MLLFFYSPSCKFRYSWWFSDEYPAFIPIQLIFPSNTSCTNKHKFIAWTDKHQKFRGSFSPIFQRRVTWHRCPDTVLHRAVVREGDHRHLHHHEDSQHQTGCDEAIAAAWLHHEVLIWNALIRKTTSKRSIATWRSRAIANKRRRSVFERGSAVLVCTIADRRQLRLRSGAI